MGARTHDCVRAARSTRGHRIQVGLAVVRVGITVRRACRTGDTRAVCARLTIAGAFCCRAPLAGRVASLDAVDVPSATRVLGRAAALARAVDAGLIVTGLRHGHGDQIHPALRDVLSLTHECSGFLALAFGNDRLTRACTQADRRVTDAIATARAVGRPHAVRADELSLLRVPCAGIGSFLRTRLVQRTNRGAVVVSAGPRRVTALSAHAARVVRPGRACSAAFGAASAGVHRSSAASRGRRLRPAAPALRAQSGASAVALLPKPPGGATSVGHHQHHQKHEPRTALLRTPRTRRCPRFLPTSPSHAADAAASNAQRQHAHRCIERARCARTPQVDNRAEVGALASGLADRFRRDITSWGRTNTRELVTHESLRTREPPTLKASSLTWVLEGVPVQVVPKRNRPCCGTPSRRSPSCRPWAAWPDCFLASAGGARAARSAQALSICFGGLRSPRAAPALAQKASRIGGIAWRWRHEQPAKPTPRREVSLPPSPGTSRRAIPPRRLVQDLSCGKATPSTC